MFTNFENLLGKLHGEKKVIKHVNVLPPLPMIKHHDSEEHVPQYKIVAPQNFPFSANLLNNVLQNTLKGKMHNQQHISYGKPEEIQTIQGHQQHQVQVGKPIKGLNHGFRDEDIHLATTKEVGTTYRILGHGKPTYKIIGHTETVLGTPNIHGEEFLNADKESTSSSSFNPSEYQGIKYHSHSHPSSEYGGQEYIREPAIKEQQTRVHVPEQKPQIQYKYVHVPVHQSERYQMVHPSSYDNGGSNAQSYAYVNGHSSPVHYQTEAPFKISQPQAVQYQNEAQVHYYIPKEQTIEYNEPSSQYHHQESDGFKPFEPSPEYYVPKQSQQQQQEEVVYYKSASKPIQSEYQVKYDGNFQPEKYVLRNHQGSYSAEQYQEQPIVHYQQEEPMHYEIRQHIKPVVEYFNENPIKTQLEEVGLEVESVEELPSPYYLTSNTTSSFEFGLKKDAQLAAESKLSAIKINKPQVATQEEIVESTTVHKNLQAIAKEQILSTGEGTDTKKTKKSSCERHCYRNKNSISKESVCGNDGVTYPNRDMLRCTRFCGKRGKTNVTYNSFHFFYLFFNNVSFPDLMMRHFGSCNSEAEKPIVEDVQEEVTSQSH